MTSPHQTLLFEPAGSNKRVCRQLNILGASSPPAVAPVQMSAKEESGRQAELIVHWYWLTCVCLICCISSQRPSISCGVKKTF